jgi:hypothetical protein
MPAVTCDEDRHPQEKDQHGNGNHDDDRQIPVARLSLAFHAARFRFVRFFVPI